MKKKWYKNWKIIVPIILVLAFIGSTSESAVVLYSEVSYEQPGLQKGDVLGYEKVLTNGVYEVGVDINPGLYNVTGIGSLDLITVKPFNIITGTKDGNYSNLVLEEGQEIEILDQSNALLNDENTDINFIGLVEETVEAKTIVETMTVTDDVETCTLDLETVECSTLKNYEELKSSLAAK